MNNSNPSVPKNPNIIYEQALQKKQPEHSIARELWGEIIPDLQTLKHFFSKKLKQERKKHTLENVEKLISALKKYHEKMGILTPKTIENMEKIVNGSILSGHQPIIFGGPGLITNKIMVLHNIQEFLEKNGVSLAPVFMIADYDGLHKELVRMYYSTPRSPNPQILDISKELNNPAQTAFHSIKNPSPEWLLKTFKSIKAVNKEFASQLTKPQQSLFQENLNHILNMLLLSYTSTENLKDWFVKFWGTITNLINDWGIIYMPVREKNISEVLTTYFSPFLTKNEQYVEAFNSKYDYLVSLGYKPSLKKRKKENPQFFIECPNDFVRIQPNIEKVSDNKFTIYGKCPVCEKEYVFNYEDGFDKEIKPLLNPKVDSSSGIVQELLNTQIRVSGPGEIAYFSLVKSGLNAIGLETPFYLKYKRVFYNTPWLETLGKKIDEKGLPSLHSKEFFSKMAALAKARRKKNIEKIPVKEKELSDFIVHVYEELLKHEKDEDVKTYLSWQFGRFSKHKFGQEVSWVWFELGKVTSLNNYFNALSKVFSENYSFGGQTYLSSSLNM